MSIKVLCLYLKSGLILLGLNSGIDKLGANIGALGEWCVIRLICHKFKNIMMYRRISGN